MDNPLLRRRPLMLLLSFLVLSLPARAGKVARFWLEDTITRQAHGPILNQPGYRFQIGTDGYVIVRTDPGQVLFSTFPQTQFMGPFDLQPNRIIDLGSRAYTIIDLESVDAPVIPSDVLPQVEPVPAPVVSPPVPPPPVIPAEPWIWEDPSSYVFTAAWFEPFRNTRYDWTLGDYEGKRASKLELSRLGVSLGWGGWEGAMGLSFRGEHSDSVLPDVEDVQDLRLEDGTGFYASLGYIRRIQLDNRWHVTLGGLTEYRNERYDLKAMVFGGTEIVLVEAPEDEESAPGEDPDLPRFIEEEVHLYHAAARPVSLGEVAVSLRGGLVYEANAWGARLDLLVNVWDTTRIDGSVRVLDNEFELKGSRSHPVSVSGAVWCYLLEGVWTEARLTFGGETALRLTLGYEW